MQAALIAAPHPPACFSQTISFQFSPFLLNLLADLIHVIPGALPAISFMHSLYFLAKILHMYSSQYSFEEVYSNASAVAMCITVSSLYGNSFQLISKPRIPAFFVRNIISAWIDGPFLLNYHEPYLQPIASPTAASSIELVKRFFIFYELLYISPPLYALIQKGQTSYSELYLSGNSKSLIEYIPLHKYSEKNQWLNSLRNANQYQKWLSRLRYKLQSLLAALIIFKQAIMSFMNWLFGKTDKKPEVAAVPAPKTEEDKKIQIEASINALEGKIKEFGEKQKKLERKIELYKTKAKEFIVAGQQKEARKYAQTATSNQKQLDSYSLRKKVLIDKKFLLEQALMDLETMAALDTPALNSREQQELARRLEQQIFETNEAKRTQNEIDQQLKNMVGNDSDDEETNDLFAELLNQVKSGKQKKIESEKNKNIKPIKQVSKEVDDVEKMLANL